MQLDRGKNVEASFCFKSSLSLFGKLKHYAGIASVLNGMARVATNQNNYPKAERFYKQIIQIYDSHFSKKNKGASYAWILYDLGRNLADQGKNIEARKYSIIALKLFRKLDIKVGIAWSFYSLSILMLNLNKNTSADICCQKALTIFRELKNPTGIPLSLHILGRIAIRQKKYELVKNYYQEKIKIWWESDKDNLLGIAFALGGFARLAAVENQPERAVRLFSAADSLHQITKSPLPPADLPEWEDSVATARIQMNESNFAKAWAIGRKIPIEKVILEALE
jgi:tetratricopeptide (TPR) repeat protein